MASPLSVAAPAPAAPVQITKKMLQSLAPLPATAIQLLGLLDKPDTSLRQMSEVAARDVGIAAAILRMANSPLLGMRGRVGSLTDALRLIGTTQARLLVLACGVAQLGQKQLPLYELPAGAFLRHSELVAALTAAIARQTDYPEIGMAYSTGLLHDIGKVMLNGLAMQDGPAGPQFEQFMKAAQQPWAAILTLEQRFFATNHPTVGRDMASLWGLPAEIGDAILLHHASGDVTEPTLPVLVALANAVAGHADSEYSVFNRAPLPEHPIVPIEPLMDQAREALK